MAFLKEYPDRLGYSIHLVNMNTGGGLGFITESQIEGCIKDKVKEIVQNKKANNTKKSSKIVNIADYRGEER